MKSRTAMLKSIIIMVEAPPLEPHHLPSSMTDQQGVLALCNSGYTTSPQIPAKYRMKNKNKGTLT